MVRRVLPAGRAGGQAGGGVTDRVAAVLPDRVSSVNVSMRCLTFDADRFREAVAYVAWKMRDDPEFGRTKLAKTLFQPDRADSNRGTMSDLGS